LAATATYLYARDHAALVPAYLDAAILPTSRATSSRGCTRGRRCTRTASPEAGTTSATPISCSRRTTACASARASRNATRTRATDVTRLRVRSARARAAPAAALPRLRRLRLAAVRLVPRRAAVAPAAAVRALRSADGVARA